MEIEEIFLQEIQNNDDDGYIMLMSVKFNNIIILTDILKL